MDEVAPGSLWTGPRDDPRRYRVDLGSDGLSSVGDGGEGLVYHAVGRLGDEEREVALKMVTSLSFHDYGRLAERSLVMAQIDHPNIMHQIETFVGTALIDREDVSEDDFELIYTVAEWVPGAPLSEALEHTDAAQGLTWVAQIARAIAFLHAYRGPNAPEGIVHRDIKPSNVRVTPEGSAVLIDFGIARPHSYADHTEGVGTYLWRAPEIVGGPGKPGLASDNWGIGALAYWVLIGEPPRLEGASVAQERLMHVAAAKGFPKPLELGSHIAPLLETVPALRPDDLAHWADNLDAGIVGTLPRRSRRRATATAAAATIAIVAIAVALLAPSANKPSGSASSTTVAPLVLARQYNSIATTVNNIIESPSETPSSILGAFSSAESRLTSLSVPANIRSALRHVTGSYATAWGALYEQYAVAATSPVIPNAEVTDELRLLDYQSQEDLQTLNAAANTFISDLGRASGHGGPRAVQLCSSCMSDPVGNG
jgi:serine/threonine protein kinase